MGPPLVPGEVWYRRYGAAKASTFPVLAARAGGCIGVVAVSTGGAGTALAGRGVCVIAVAAWGAALAW